MIDQTLPMPTPEAAEGAANVCIAIDAALRTVDLRKRYRLLGTAQAIVRRNQPLKEWLDELAKYRRADK